MSFKCVVVDDEFLAIEVIENYINRVPYLSLAAKFNNGIDALAYLQSTDVDILFVDIQMPDMNGMSLLKLLDKNINVVFTSAYPDYALEGYDFNPLDFLVKPISFEKFMRAVSRAKSPESSGSENNNLNEQYFFIKAKGKTIKLLISDILYIQGLKDYVIFYTTGTQYISLHSMKELEEKLPEDKFVRIHKSYIVEHTKIEEAHTNYVKIGENKIPVGRIYKSHLQEIIEKKKL
jgi:two-component system, LytTR family, response regulator